MFLQKFSQTILLVLFFSFFLFQSYLQSQEKQNKILSKINVTMVASEGGFSDLEMKVIDSFKKALEEKGLLTVNQSDFDVELLLDVKEIDEDNKIALSVVIMDVIPKEAVSLGAKQELFYSMLDEEKKSNLPEEGKFIREYVSAEYLKQFRMIWNSYLEVIDINELNDFSRKIVSEFSSRYKIVK